jgi:hypothetical protein
VRESGKAKVEIVVDTRLLKTLWFGDRRPYLGQVLDEGGSEVGKRRSAEMIANNEEEK